MLKKLILENWKSFRYAELPIDPLTVLIGTNASGKSNVVEALEFLQRIVRGEDIEAALAGDKTFPSIRGGVEWAALKPETQFTLKAMIQGEDEKTDYLYVIKIQTQPVVRIIEEYIDSQKYLDNITDNFSTFYIKSFDFQTKSGLKEVWGMIPIEELDRDKIYKIYPEELKNILDGRFILINTVKTFVIKALESILILNPIPSQMRDYSPLSDSLESNASNIAGVLAALPDEQKAEIEATISTYIKNLPEGDIQRIWAEKVGRFGTDAMLYCEELWKPGQITEIDARSMSDGTLRFLAILTALLTRPKGSQLIIEEIDNGLHPSRAELLVRMLREIANKRNIDILFTTHNPALLDALGPEIVPFVVVAHRDSETGESQLTVVEDIQNFPKLFASASLGKLTVTGAIERSLSRNE
ncbi:AAA family ATPase [Hassallia byssoidea VB512170]|uniref:AAA family ATPase n=1 Tax=Hassallia byssoidea VB512170 TaxID=1304833 RepID=A0A846H347_9CYAN|nr:ATP-binding protein [Hassalia byssoidea]NEU71050.1 AAA family ATPase [Hassalia byssoidea VB512170]